MPGIPVGTSLIDAHAGGVGVIESVPPSEAEGCHDLPYKLVNVYHSDSDSDSDSNKRIVFLN